MGYLLVIAVALGIAYRSTTAAERKRYAQTVLKVSRAAGQTLEACWLETEQYRAKLRARTPVAPITPTIVAVNIAIVLGILLHDGRALDDPDALIAWGASVGPHTANGEGWRLLTAQFVHASVIGLLVNLVALLPLGLVLERLVGPVAFAAVYLVSGLFAHLFTMSVFPLEVASGAAGSVAGVYAFMLAVSMWGVSQRPMLVVPLVAAKWLVVSAGLFTGYVVLIGASASVVVGFGCGLLSGLIVARGVNRRRTPAVRMTATAATMICVAAVTAVPLKGITDARRELQAVVATEEVTSNTFRTALEEFGLGRTNAGKVADVIDLVIVPELEHARAQLAAIEKVPPEQEPLIAAAWEYLHLRHESWAIRSMAFRTGKMQTLRAADAKESTSLAALRQLR